MKLGEIAILRELLRGRKMGVRPSGTRFWIDNQRSPSLSDSLVAPMMQKYWLKEIRISEERRIVLSEYGFVLAERTTAKTKNERSKTTQRNIKRQRKF